MRLQDLDHFKNDVRVQFKEEVVDGHRFTTVSYMIADNEFWKIPLSLETRGNTFDSETGQCVGRSLEKFFNLNERESTQLNTLLEQNDDYEIYTKRDGSLSIPVRVGDRIWFKTKKSFYSDVARDINAWVQSQSHLIRFCEKMIEIQYTPIFEYTDPAWRIVVNYEDCPKLTLLTARHQDYGSYFDFDTLSEIANDFGVPVIEKMPFVVIHDLIKSCETTKGIEGYVVHFLDCDGNRTMVKLKTAEYLRRHRVRTCMRERDVAEMVINETLDDCISAVQESGEDVEKVYDIERRVVKELGEIRNRLNTIVSSLESKDPKTVALAFKGHPLFSLLMKQIRGIEPDYTEYWKRNHLSQYSLRTVYSENF